MPITQERNVMEQMDSLFHPRSIAVVGVPRGMKMGKLFLMALQDMGFPGPIYPVHPEAKEIDGLKAYPNVLAIPGPVDLAIVLVPHTQALSVIEECAAKGVKTAVLFTAGYRETGTEAGRRLEEALVGAAKGKGMRLIGPNCMGLYSPKSGLSFFPGLSREQGSVGVISHSGSLTNILGRMAPQKGIRFSKVVSLGNECDLNSGDFLAYLGQDRDTSVIGGYLEGVKDGPFFLSALRDASLHKPVILWKMGLTPEGRRAASSHTGAMAGPREVWDGVVRQGGGITVDGFEAWVDALMAFSMLNGATGDRMAIISGPGGLAVSAAEACGRAGLRLASLGRESRSILSRIVPPTGTSLSNPVDVGLTASLEIGIYSEAAQTVAQDPGVDVVVVIGIGLSPETNRQYTDAMIEVQHATGKPLLMVNIPGFDPGLATEFCEAGIPFFDSAERAMKAYSRIRQYHLWRKTQGQERRT